MLCYITICYQYSTQRRLPGWKKASLNLDLNTEIVYLTKTKNNQCRKPVGQESRKYWVQCTKEKTEGEYKTRTRDRDTEA